MSPIDGPLDVAVCHYNRHAVPDLRHMAAYAMAFLRRDRTSDLRVTLVDGSPRPDVELARTLEALAVRYVHCGRELSFAETYNTGIRMTTSGTIVLMANDILIEGRQVRMLAQEVHDGVGCAFPYLSFSDYGAQKARRLRVPRRCYPTRMTLNVNAFSREALEKVGFIPAQMTGCFNDVILSIRLYEEGYSVVLRNVGPVAHLGRQTLRTRATSISHDADARLFAAEYPHYWRDGVVLFHKAAQGRATRLLYRVAERLPAQAAQRLGVWSLVWTLEPYLCAERGTAREGLCRLFRRAQAVSATPACAAEPVQR